MPWTVADREIILQAMRDIAKGERVTEVTTADRQETRQIASLDDLKKLLDQIDSATTPAAQRPRLLRSRYNKGL